jgi:hypothetical protein
LGAALLLIPTLGKARTNRSGTPAVLSTRTGTASFWSRRATRFLSEISRADRSNQTPRIVRTEVKFNGLGAQALRLIDAVALADLVGGRLSVVRLHYWNYGCGSGRTWDCYFDAQWLQEAEANSGVLETPDRKTQRCQELTRLSAGQLLRGACANISSQASELMATALWQRLDYPDSLQAARAIARRIWPHNSETQIRVDELCEEAGLGPHGVTLYVGVHIRRGDKVKEVPSVPIARFIEAIDIIAPPHMPLFVASDDGATVRALREMTQRRVLALPHSEKRIGHLQRSVNRIAAKHKPDLVHEILADIQALTRASWFIGTFSSNMGRLVHVLRDQPPETSISLDDRWAPGVAFHTFRQPYCEWEGANKLYCSTRTNSKL